MRINVAAQLKLPGRAGECSLTQTLPEIDYGGTRIAFSGPVKVDAVFVYDGGAFLVKGRVSAVLKTRCARCDEPLEQAVSVEFDERFVRTLSGDEDESYLFSGEELDLSAMAQDCLLLNIPAYAVCRKDCRGLCPHCGRNLNKAQCSCDLTETADTGRDEEAQHPFKYLGQLLNEDKEV